MAQTPPEHALEVDDSAADGDSTFGSSVGSATYETSLSSSIRNYKYENGRRYHAYREGTYTLPNDEEEQDRMELVHHIYFLLLQGKLHLSPVNRPQRVLDIGTGTGSWAVDFADEYPSAEVLGTDLSPIQPPWVPPNCSFEIDDYEAEWTYSRPFDLIHGRELMGFVTDYGTLFGQAFKHLRSGGYLEVQTADVTLLANEGDMRDKAVNLQHWVAEMHKASEQFGKSMTLVGTWEDEMKKAGFVDVTREIRKAPVGPWPKDPKLKEIGKYHQAQILEAVGSYTPALFTRQLGYSTQEMEVLCAAVRAEVKNSSLHLYQEFNFVYGRKP